MHLHVPSDTSGAEMNVTQLHDELVETVVQLDEPTLEKYFEGEQPSDDKLDDLVMQAPAG